MENLMIELDEQTLRAAEDAARKAGCPVSEWVSRRVEEAAGLSAKGWPDGYFDRLASFQNTDLEEPAAPETALDDVIITKNTEPES